MFSKKVKTMLGLVVLLLPLMINGCSPSQIPVSGASNATTQETATWLDQPVMALDSELVAEGRVVPLKHVNLSFPSVGVVDEVNFNEGAQVQKGQVIARLNGAEKMAAEVVSAEVVVFTVKKEKEDLIENAIYSRIQAELKLVEAQRALEKAQKARNSKNYKRGSDYQIDVATADYKTLEEQFKMLRDYFNTLSGRSEDDLARSNALLKMNEAKAKLDGALNTLNTLQSMPSKLDVSEADAKLHMAEVDLEKAQQDLLDLQNGPRQDDLDAADMKIKDAEAKLAAAKASLSDLELVAPINGTVVRNPLAEGQLVGPDSTPVILADLSNLEIQTTDLSELSVVRVQAGDKVQISFDAIPELKLTGSVTAINGLGEDRRGDMIYTVYIRLDKLDPRLLWNMTANVTFGR